MKRILMGAVVFVTLSASAQKPADKKFTIQGDLGNIAENVAWVYLGYSTEGENKSDSIQPAQGKYIFNGEIGEPTLVRLWVKLTPDQDGKPRMVTPRRDYASVFIQPGTISVSNIDSFSNTKVTGSAAHEEYLKLNEQAKPFNARIEEIFKGYGDARKNNNEAEMEKIMASYEAVNKEMKEKVYAAYVKNNPKAPLALYALKSFAGWDINPKVVEPLFQTLPKGAQASFSGKTMAESIAIAKKTGVGAVAMEFSQNDTLGNPVALSSFRGKFLLVDFWASWCGPCRAENPNVVKAFQQYKDKGFHVLGISLDRPGAKDKWIKAIHDDKLTWTHVSDLQFWKNAVAVQYGIRAIPQNFLIDPKGVIIGKNLTKEALQKKLAEVMN